MAAPTSVVNWNFQSISQLLSFTMTDGTSADGQITAQLTPGIILGYAVAGDTTPTWELGTVSSNPTLAFGVGGSTATDISIARTASGVLSLTAFINAASGGGGLSLNPSLSPTTYTSGSPPNFVINNGSTYVMNYSNGTVGNMVDFKGTISFTTAGAALGSGQGFVFEPLVKNTAGSAVGIGLFSAIVNAPTIQADTSTVANMGTVFGFVNNPTLAVTAGGVITSMSITGFRGSGTVPASTGVGNYIHFQANQPGGSGSGTITTLIGYDVGAFSFTGATNIGIRNASPTCYTHKVKTITATTDAISVAATTASTFVTLNNTSGSSKTLASTPTITAGTDGQYLIIENTSAQNVVFQRESALPGSTLRLSAASITLAQYQTLMLIWDSVNSQWVQLSTAANA
jgi:hypothetical protein